VGWAGCAWVISDQHAGLVAALKRAFQGSAHQRCRVYFARNLLALVPKSHQDMVAAVFRTSPNSTPATATEDHLISPPLRGALPISSSGLSRQSDGYFAPLGFHPLATRAITIPTHPAHIPRAIKLLSKNG